MNKKICIIGSGNVATCMSQLFFDNGHSIIQVYSRTKKHAEQLASVYSCAFTSDIHELTTEAGLYFIAVEDKAISEVASSLKFENKLVVHCSGSASIEILNQCSNQYGVMYPLQSLNAYMSKSLPDFPIIIEGNNSEVETQLNALVDSLKRKSVVMNFAQRQQLHLAAVFINNFTNHMVAIGEKILDENHLSQSLLKPLIESTFNKINFNGAAKSQTGPAVRNDQTVINKHLELLNSHPDWKKIYSELSNSIIEFYK